jgi:type II secretory pathway pseudopilin PulG
LLERRAGDSRQNVRSNDLRLLAGSWMPPTRARRAVAAFTLIEVLVTVASLIIVLGLMASLARSVRRQASDRQTKSLLMTLGVLLDKYVARHDRLPTVTPFVSTARSATGSGASDRAAAADGDPLPDEPQLRDAARANNRDVVAALRTEAGPSVDIFGPAGGPRGAPGDDRLPDAWGRDIVFMPRGHPAIGTALQDLPFFFSAGPDGRYQTLEDNLYSYEIAPVQRE